MKNFTLLTLGALLVGAGANAERVASPKALAQTAKTSYSIAKTVKETETGKPFQTKQSRRAKADVKRKTAIQYPGNHEFIEPEDGEETVMVKNGFAYGYSWFYGIVSSNLDGAISTTVKSDDGTKLYLQGPFFLDSYSEDNWLVGDIEGDTVTFSFPQLIDEEIDDEEPEYNAWYYAMKLQFVVQDEETQEGWYYTTENQEFKFRIEADGSLTSLEEEGTMIGECLWIEGEDGEEDHWSWQATGDVITDMHPNTAVELEVPEGVEFTEWQLFSDISARGVMVGIDGDSMYIKGLFNRYGMSDKAVVGKIDGDKVTFENGQYLGEYWDYRTVAYFDAGVIDTAEEDGQTYQYFKITDNIVFNWDKEKNILSSDGAFCISSSPEKVIYYILMTDPYISIPETNPVVTAIQKPANISFFDANDQYDWDASFYFDIPIVTADHQLLNTDDLYYEVFMDGELFTFYDDEYELPEGMTEMTQVPYDYASVDTYDFDAYGVNHGFEFHTRGFESLGVRIVYKQDGKDLYSDIVYAPGYEVSGISSAFEGKEVKGLRYYDLSGCAVEHPSVGIFVKQTVYSDGSVKTSKVVKK